MFLTHNNATIDFVVLLAEGAEELGIRICQEGTFSPGEEAVEACLSNERW